MVEDFRDLTGLHDALKEMKYRSQERGDLTVMTRDRIDMSVPASAPYR